MSKLEEVNVRIKTIGNKPIYLSEARVITTRLWKKKVPEKIFKKIWFFWTSHSMNDLPRFFIAYANTFTLENILQEIQEIANIDALA